MGKLSTHVLDTAQGRPAAGMAVTLYRIDRDKAWLLLSLTLNADGRSKTPLLEGVDLQIGRYRIVFEVGAYFREQGAVLPTPMFLDQVPLEFGVADASAHYHVPLLVSPWGYSTYRGS